MTEPLPRLRLDPSRDIREQLIEFGRNLGEAGVKCQGNKRIDRCDSPLCIGVYCPPRE